MGEVTLSGSFLESLRDEIIGLEDRDENLGVQMLRQAASITSCRARPRPSTISLPLISCSPPTSAENRALGVLCSGWTSRNEHSGALEFALAQVA